MSAPGYDEALKQYQRMWRRTALIPSSTFFLFWTYLAFTCEAKDSPDNGVVTMLRSAHIQILPWDGPAVAIGMAVGLLHYVSVLSPMLAWVRVRGAMRRAPMPPEPAQGAYRAGPPAPRSWHVSGPFPWWTAVMLFVAVLIHAYWLYLQLVGAFASWGLAPPWTIRYPLLESLLVNSVGGLVHVCFFCFWGMMCRRDGSRVGVLEEATADDGYPRLTLHTLREVRPVTIAAWDRSSRKLRVDGSRNVWHAVAPLDDLVSVDHRRTAA
jgi:hypothetical protein